MGEEQVEGQLGIRRVTEGGRRMAKVGRGDVGCRVGGGTAVGGGGVSGGGRGLDIPYKEIWIIGRGGGNIQRD